MNEISETGLVGKTETRKRRRLVGNHSLYRFLFEQGPNVNVLIGLDGLIKDVNSRWLKELGYSKEEVVGRPALDFVVPGDKAKVAAQLEKDLRGEPTPQLEVTVHAKDGSMRTILFTPGQLLLRKGGKPSAVLVTGTDITERKRLEDALRKSESRYRKMAESLTDMFFAMDAELRYTYWNKASEEFTGIKAENALGKSIFDLFPDNEETRRAVAIYQEVLKTRQPKNFVTQYTWKGKTYFFDINVYPLEDGILVLARDVTELKSVEEELRSAKEELQLIYDNLQDNVTFLDSEFRVLRVNRPDDTVFGLKRKEMVGRRCFEVLGDPSLKGPCPECPVKEALETGRPGRSSRWRRDGRFIELTAIPLRGPDGQVSRVVEIGRDLTEYKEAEERLREYSKDLERMVEERTQKLQESNRFLETVLENIPEPVFIKDRSFRYVMSNRADRSLLGMSMEEVIGKTDYDLYPKEEADFFRKGDLEVVGKGFAVEFPEEKVTGKDGITRLYHVKKAPIKDDNGEVAYIVGVSKDITELKRLEKELERSRDEVKRLNESLTLSLMRSNKLLSEVSNLREKLRKAADTTVGLDMILNSALTNLNLEMGGVLMLDSTGGRVRARAFQALFEGFKLNDEYPLSSRYVELEALERRKPVSRILQPGESSILGARSVNCAPIY
ncbi:MAG: PAS domain S-box protein, partial [Candidatus Bathyarchaeia archaeon]